MFRAHVPSLLGRASQAPGGYCRCSGTGVPWSTCCWAFAAHPQATTVFFLHEVFRLHEMKPLARKSTLGISRSRTRSPREFPSRGVHARVKEMSCWVTPQDIPREDEDKGDGRSRDACHGWRRSRPPYWKIRKDLAPPVERGMAVAPFRKVCRGRCNMVEGNSRK
jgi:hypothetical protein